MPEGLATSVEHFRSPGQHIGGVIEGGDKTPLIVIGPFIPSIMAGAGDGTINEMGRTDAEQTSHCYWEEFLGLLIWPRDILHPPRPTDDHLAANPTQPLILGNGLFFSALTERGREERWTVLCSLLLLVK